MRYGLAAMRITSFNANGIRSAHSKGFTAWMQRHQPDVVCLQELKAHLEVIPDECRTLPGYCSFFHPALKPGYSGVGLLTKKQPLRVLTGLGIPEFDSEGRYLQADFENLSVVSIYFPSGSSGEHRQNVKFAFLSAMDAHLKRLSADGRDYIICGDFNIAHKEIDLKNWRSNQKNSGFLPEERAFMDRLLDVEGWVDAFRVVNQKPEQYTWWSSRGQAYDKNVGWRIDYHLVSPGLKPKIKSAAIYKNKKFSDHAPLTIEYQMDF